MDLHTVCVGQRLYTVILVVLLFADKVSQPLEYRPIITFRPTNRAGMVGGRRP